jgi:hypothetical protein
MTTALDTALRDAVKAVAAALGTTVIVTVVTAGVYSTATGGATDTVAARTVQGFVLEEKDLDAFGLAKVGDRSVLIPASALATEPVATQDRFTIGSTSYAILQVDRIRARDLAAAYVLHGEGPA